VYIWKGVLMWSSVAWLLSLVSHCNSCTISIAEIIQNACWHFPYM